MEKSGKEKIMGDEERVIEQPIGFADLAAIARVINSKDRSMKLSDCIDFELKELMQKINEYNKAGKMTITIDIGIAEKNELDIQAEVKIAPPKGKKPSNAFFRDQRGRLFAADPMEQTHLFDMSKVRKQDPEERKEANNV